MHVLLAEAFVTVVNAGSIHRAAARLGVSPATVSRRLAELERDLGQRLIERTTRSLRVTDLGRAFHAQCTRGFEALADAHDLVASNLEHVRGTVRISCPPNIGALLLPAIAGVRIAHPEIQVLFVETERRLERADDIDLFIRGGAVTDDRLVVRPLATYSHVLFASKRYATQHGLPSTPAHLAKHALITFGSGRRSAGWNLVSKKGAPPIHLDVRPVLSSNDYATIASAVHLGLGIAELPAILREQRASLVRVLPAWSLGEVTLKLLFASDRLLSKAVRAVIDSILATVPRAWKELARST